MKSLIFLAALAAVISPGDVVATKPSDAVIRKCSDKIEKATNCLKICKDFKTFDDERRNLIQGCAQSVTAMPKEESSTLSQFQSKAESKCRTYFDDDVLKGRSPKNVDQFSSTCGWKLIKPPSGAGEAKRHDVKEKERKGTKDCNDAINGGKCFAECKNIMNEGEYQKKCLTEYMNTEEGKLEDLLKTWKRTYKRDCALELEKFAQSEASKAGKEKIKTHNRVLTACLEEQPGEFASLECKDDCSGNGICKVDGCDCKNGFSGENCARDDKKMADAVSKCTKIITKEPVCFKECRQVIEKDNDKEIKDLIDACAEQYYQHHNHRVLEQYEQAYLTPCKAEVDILIAKGATELADKIDASCEGIVFSHCPGQCSGNGRCLADGSCKCKTGWGDKNCSVNLALKKEAEVQCGRLFTDGDCTKAIASIVGGDVKKSFLDGCVHDYYKTPKESRIIYKDWLKKFTDKASVLAGLSTDLKKLDDLRKKCKITLTHCPDHGKCNGNGVCEAAGCKCTRGFDGADCSNDLNLRNKAYHQCQGKLTKGTCGTQCKSIVDDEKKLFQECADKYYAAVQDRKEVDDILEKYHEQYFYKCKKMMIDFAKRDEKNLKKLAESVRKACPFEIEPCPCKNGKCTAFGCACAKGWSGDLCEINQAAAHKCASKLRKTECGKKCDKIVDQADFVERCAHDYGKNPTDETLEHWESNYMKACKETVNKQIENGKQDNDLEKAARSCKVPITGCPNNCSSKGECKLNKKCVCQKDWEGDDCSKYSRLPFVPVAYKPEYLKPLRLGGLIECQAPVLDKIYGENLVTCKLIDVPTGTISISAKSHDLNIDNCNIVFTEKDIVGTKRTFSVAPTLSFLESKDKEATIDLKICPISDDDRKRSSETKEVQGSLHVYKQYHREAECSSTGDPHFKNLDGEKFNYQGKGTFWLFKSDILSIQVHHFPCNGKTTCNNGIAIYWAAAGEYTALFLPKTNHGHPLNNHEPVWTNQAHLKAIKLARPANHTWIAEMPDGTQVKVLVNGNRNLGIHLYLKENLYGKEIGGLCGPKQTNNITAFGDSWAVIEKDHNLFASKKLEALMMLPIPFAGCTVMPNCEVVTGDVAKGVDEANGNPVEVKGEPINYPIAEFTPPPKDDSNTPPRHDKCLALADDVCVKQCAQFVDIQQEIEDCHFDVDRSDELAVHDAMDDIRELCSAKLVEELAKNTVPERDEELIDIQVDCGFVEFACPNDCFAQAGRGACTEKGCECVPEWMGSDCSIPCVFVSQPVAGKKCKPKKLSLKKRAN